MKCIIKYRNVVPYSNLSQVQVKENEYGILIFSLIEKHYAIKQKQSTKKNWDIHSTISKYTLVHVYIYKQSTFCTINKDMDTYSSIHNTLYATFIYTINFASNYFFCKHLLKVSFFIEKNLININHSVSDCTMYYK